MHGHSHASYGHGHSHGGHRHGHDQTNRSSAAPTIQDIIAATTANNGMNQDQSHLQVSHQTPGSGMAPDHTSPVAAHSHDAAVSSPQAHSSHMFNVMQQRMVEAMRLAQIQQQNDVYAYQSGPPSQPHSFHLQQPPHPTQPRTYSQASPPPDERSILLSNPPIRPNHLSPTPFAPPQLNGGSIPFLASAGGQSTVGSNVNVLPPAILNNPMVRIVVEHPLIFAVKANDGVKVAELLKVITAECIDGDGNSALHWAAQKNCQHSVVGSIVDLLLKHGASAGCLNRTGETPLHWAADAGAMSATRSLLRQNYSLLFARDANGWTPWHRAAQKGHILYLDFLLHFHPPTDWTTTSTQTLTLGMPDAANKTALHWAAYNNNALLVEWLLSNGSESMLYDVDSEQALPIHWAALRGNKQIVELLLTYQWKSHTTTNRRSNSHSVHAPLLSASSFHDRPPSPANNSLSSDSIGFQLHAVDVTGMNALQLAIDKRKRLQNQLAEARRQQETEMRVLNPNSNPILLGTAGSASVNFSIRNYSWKQWLCCCFPLVLAILAALGVLDRISSWTSHYYESCRKGLGMTYSHEYDQRQAKMTEDERYIKHLDKTISAIEAYETNWKRKEMLGLNMPTTTITKFITYYILPYLTLPSQGWFISRWLGFIMISGGYFFVTRLWPMVDNGQHPILEGLFIIAWSTMIITFAQCVYGDPGWIQGKKQGLFPFLRSLAGPSSSAAITNRFTMLRSEYSRILTTANDSEAKHVCTTCRIYRTPRSKHCRTCGKCCDRFDHHCPSVSPISHAKYELSASHTLTSCTAFVLYHSSSWIHNCVGQLNHRVFIYFLASANLTIILLFIITGIYYWRLPSPMASMMDEVTSTSSSSSWFPTIPSLLPGLALEPYFFSWIGHYLFYLALLSSLLYQHISLIKQNLTINEAVNWYKYPSFQSTHGSFINPYDRGVKPNCRQFFCEAQENQIPKLPSEQNNEEHHAHREDDAIVTVQVDQNGKHA